MGEILIRELTPILPSPGPLYSKIQPFPGASQLTHPMPPPRISLPLAHLHGKAMNDPTLSAHFNPIALLKPRFHDIKHMNMIFGLILQYLNSTAEESCDEQTLEWELTAAELRFQLKCVDWCVFTLQLFTRISDSLVNTCQALGEALTSTRGKSESQTQSTWIAGTFQWAKWKGGDGSALTLCCVSDTASSSGTHGSFALQFTQEI